MVRKAEREHHSSTIVISECIPRRDTPDHITEKFNKHIRDMAKSSHVKITSMYTPFSSNLDSYYSNDEIHPNG